MDLDTKLIENTAKQKEKKFKIFAILSNCPIFVSRTTNPSQTDASRTTHERESTNRLHGHPRVCRRLAPRTRGGRLQRCGRGHTTRQARRSTSRHAAGIRGEEVRLGARIARFAAPEDERPRLCGAVG